MTFKVFNSILVSYCIGFSILDIGMGIGFLDIDNNQTFAKIPVSSNIKISVSVADLLVKNLTCSLLGKK